jgi:O-antigen/teichoic acid export membrane protein
VKWRQALAAVAGQASPLVLGRIASAVLTFALPLALARALDPRAFGSYKQLFLVAQTILLAGQLGLTQSLYFFLPRGGPQRGAYLLQTILCLGAIALACAAALFFGGPSLARHFHDSALGELRLPLAILSSGLLLAAPLEAALTSEGRIGLSAIAYVISDATRAALLFLGARSGGLPGLAWAAALYAGLRVVGLVVLCAVGAIPIAAATRATLWRQLVYSLPLAGSVWLWVAQRQFALYAVAAHFDAARFALFAIASFHLPVVDILYSPIGEILMVRVGRIPATDRAGRLREWDDSVEKLASILWPAAACAWLTGPSLLPLLFTAKYASAVPLFLLATLEIPFWCFPADSLLKACGATRFLFYWYCVRVALTASTALLGIHFFGLAGAILASVIGEAISRAVMIVRSRRELDVPLAGVLDLRGLGRIALASALATIPALAARSLVDGPASVIVCAVAYGATYLLLRFVSVPAATRAATLNQSQS